MVKSFPESQVLIISMQNNLAPLNSLAEKVEIL